MIKNYINTFQFLTLLLTKKKKQRKDYTWQETNYKA